MKKLLLFFLLLSIGAGIYFCYKYSNIYNNKTKKITIFPTKKIEKKEEKPKTKITNRSIFIPYWSLDSFPPADDEYKKYERYIYFGIMANSQGIDKQETGYMKLDQFAKAVKGKDTYLTLRLLNNNFNQELLEDTSLQQKIIEQTLAVADENDFKGVVLDLELFSLFNTDVKDQINKFVQSFYTAAKTDYKLFGLVIYGDVFYRKRPYDLSFLSKNADEILVMAYDFSKTIGEPGPNFPYDMGLKYNYSFKKMINDFKSVVPTEKLTIVFGMFGYDWQVDEKKRPITTAKALTLKEIAGSIPGMEKACRLENCLIKRDELSKETEINYTSSSKTPDEQGIYRIDYHIVWFEDEESVAIKTDYLQTQGISRVGYWAYGYF
jgi:spore germination protein YaaH